MRKEAPTSASYLTAWARAEPEPPQGTGASYQEHIRKYLIPHLGEARSDRPTSRQVEAMFDAVEESNEHILEYGESERENVRVSVRDSEEPVNINAVSHARLPSCPRKKPLVWTPSRPAPS